MVEFCLYPILNVLISNVTLAFGNFESRSLNMGILGQKNISFLMLMKFWLYPILKVLILNLTFIFNDFEPESPNLKTLTKKNELFSFNKILPAYYFKGADLKPDIRFLWFLAPYYPEYMSQFNVSVFQLIWKRCLL